ncbi:hypothetical protein AWB73_05377 [Caballeronia turbans]|nr:hypothetical protein AWB73_05377 [Caballeronia turbans]
MNNVRFYAFAAYLAISAPSTGYAQVTEVVVGEGRNPPAFQGMTYPCSTDLESVGRAFCAQHSSSGAVTGDFFLSPLSQQAGGKCGWTRYRVECKR